MECMAKIHACVIAGGLFDDGPSEAALQLARDLAEQLTRAVDDFETGLRAKQGVK
jgi:hypothetical protein